MGINQAREIGISQQLGDGLGGQGGQSQVQPPPCPTPCLRRYQRPHPSNEFSGRWMGHGRGGELKGRH